MAFRRILVSYDASPDGDEALFTAAELARMSRAELVVAATAPVEPVRYVGLAVANTWNRLAREDARKLLDRAALLLEDLHTPRRVVLEGADVQRSRCAPRSSTATWWCCPRRREAHWR